MLYNSMAKKGSFSQFSLMLETTTTADDDDDDEPFYDEVVRDNSETKSSQSLLINKTMFTVNMTGKRQQVLQLYRDILRLAKTWEAKVPSETVKEKDFIRSEARTMFRANKDISDAEELDKKLDEAKTRLEIAKHYRIPYPRPVYFATGTLTRLEKKKLAFKSKSCKGT